MKTRWIQLIAGFTMFVLCISVCTTNTNADVGWSEDFESELDGWVFYGYENTSSQVMIEGNFSASSGMLEVLDDYINIARHDSTVNVGTWSFDMYVPDDDYGAIYVQFMSNGTVSWAGATNHSFVAVGAWLTGGRFVVWREKGSNGYILSNIYDITLEGWHHIEVNRTSDNHFKVYFNGTLRADFYDNGVTSSTHLQFSCNNASGAAIDNLVVVDGTPIPTPTTTPITTPTTTPTSNPPPIDPVMIGLIGGIGGGVVILLAIVLLRRR